MHLIKEINVAIESVFKEIRSNKEDLSFLILDRGQPHEPMSLPKNKRAVYMFIHKSQFLKIGKAGVNSNARFQSQHYNPNSANSTLAKSLLADEDMKSYKLNENNVSSWIKNNCRRIDVLIDSSTNIFKLDLIEAILHYKYKPKYEGFNSQRNITQNNIDLEETSDSIYKNDEKVWIESGNTKRKSEMKRSKSGNPTIDEVRSYIRKSIIHSFKNGQTTVKIRSGDIHKELCMNNAFPTVSSAMKTLGETFNYEVVKSPPKGQGANLIHIYFSQSYIKDK